MRILHVVPYFYPAWAYGGPPRAVYEIAIRQVEKGHLVDVLTTDAFEKNKTLKTGIEKLRGVSIIRLKNLSNKVMWRLHFPLPFGLSEVDTVNYDIIHIHETRTLLNSYVLSKLKPHQKVVYSPWGTFPLNDRLKILKKMFDHIFLKDFSKKIDLSLGQNDHEVSILKQAKIGNKIETLPLGIDTNFFKKRLNIKLARKKMGIPDEFTFLYLGRFSKEKGLGLLIDSFEKLAQQYPKVNLLIVGRDDGFLNSMQSIIKQSNFKKRIFIKGPLYNKERLVAYYAANAFVYTPIVYEETSTACLEALAAGILVITTQKAQIPFFTMRDGVYHTKDSISSIVDAMAKVLSTKQKVNLKKVTTNFDWNSLVTKLDNLYDLANEKR